MELVSDNHTKVYNLNNSFVSISDSNTTLWMDPLKFNANLGAWAAWGENISFTDILANINVTQVDYIYISHLHTDHFDKCFLAEIIKTQKKIPYIIVKAFDSKRFINQIKKVWPEEYIIEVEEYSLLQIGTMEICIFPQISTSSAQSETLIDYDLDTSAIVKTKDGIVFNEVDNPYSLIDYDDIVSPKLKELGLEEISIAFAGYSGASPYPQCHVNINRAEENERIKKITLSRFFEVGRKLKPQYLIPAGGSYKLDYPFDYQNNYISVPTIEEIIKFNENYNDVSIIDPMSSLINIDKGDVRIELRKDILPRAPQIKDNYNNNLPYKLKCDRSSLKNEIIDMIDRIEKNFPPKLGDIYNNLRTNITIMTHSEIPIIDKDQISTDKLLYQWNLFGKISPTKTIKRDVQLDIHISGEAFLKWGAGELSWNELIYHALYNRKPDIYEPDALMFLNLYKEWN